MERAPKPLTREAIRYTWRQLAQRIGIPRQDGSGSITGFEVLGVDVHYGRPERGVYEPPAIIVVPAEPVTWSELLDAAPHSLTWLPVKRLLPRDAISPVSGDLPVLFWGSGCEGPGHPPVRSREDGSVVFYIDIIATAFFMLSRWEETVTPTRDEHERFPARASVAYKQGFLDRPIVDEYALILRAWLEVMCPSWEPETRQGTFQLTHDVDRLLRFPNCWKGLRTVAGDLVKRRSLGLARNSGIHTLARLVNPVWDHYYGGVQRLADISSNGGLSSDAFYFMVADPGPFDQGYDTTLVRSTVEALVDQGFEIGLHASYNAFNDPVLLSVEKRRMDRILGKSEYGGRQHYLRFQVPETWRLLEQVGLTYDATMTYPRQPGFRCGSCYPHRPFDIEEDRELQILEHPLIVMDGALKSKEAFVPRQGEEEILELAQRCRSVGGEFSLLWHNTSFYGDWRPWAQMYERVVSELVKSFG